MYRTDFLDKHPFTALFVIFVVAMAISTMIAYFLEKIAYRPLRGAPRLDSVDYRHRGLFLFAVHVSRILRIRFSGVSGYRRCLRVFWMIFGIRILKFQVVVILAAILLMAALYSFIMLTRAGKAIRAVSEDKEASALMGINVDGMISTTFVIGGMSAGAAGVLYALMFKQVHFFMGFIPGLKAFTAAVLGGIGNIPGAMLGGIFLRTDRVGWARVSFWTAWESSPRTS